MAAPETPKNKGWIQMQMLLAEQASFNFIILHINYSKKKKKRNKHKKHSILQHIDTGENQIQIISPKRQSPKGNLKNKILSKTLEERHTRSTRKPKGKKQE